MDTKTVFVDFSKIHLTKSEWKLLCSVTNSIKRKVERPADAERLCDLGLAELYEPVGKEAKSQTLFSTSLGNEYVEYVRARRREKRLDTIKWIIPLVLSIIALVLAIRSNWSGTGIRTNNNNNNRNTTSYSTNTTGQQNNSNAGMNTQNNSNAGGASQEAGGGQSGSASQGGNTGMNTQNNSNAGGASQEAGGGQAGGASGGASN